MKSLVLKDLYNIGHNVRYMLLLLVIFAVAFIPTSGVTEYMFICAAMCSMMVVTTFSFDEQSRWARYAMIMPVAGKDLVRGKFIVSAVFCGAGSIAGLLIGTIGGLLTGQIALDGEGITGLMYTAFMAWMGSMVYGGMTIPVALQFGAERSRMILVLVVIPLAFIFGVYQIYSAQGMEVAGSFLHAWYLPVIVLVWIYGMYRISCRIFLRQEL